MVRRAVALAAVVALLASGCSDEPDDLDRLPVVGTTTGGATIRADVVDDRWIDVLVVDGNDVRCRARGPVETAPSIALCSGSSPSGTTYVAPVRKDAPDRRLCAVETGATVPSERVVTPAGWPVDLVVSLTPDEGAYAVPCRRL